MTKRFKLIGDSNLEVLMQHQLELPIYDYNNKKSRLSLNTTLNLLNSLYEENEELKQENQSWLKTATHFDNVAHKDRDYAKRMHRENKELKEELAKFKEWEKHIRDVRREDLDRVFKMSIYEIAEAFDYYKERIKKLEKELQK